MQSLGSACAYGRRYTTKDLLNIVTTGEDDDAAATSQKVAAPDEPAGFSNWADDMSSAAQEGGAVFNPAWAASKSDFTTYALKHRRALTEGWKATVKKAGHRG